MTKIQNGALENENDGQNKLNSDDIKKKKARPNTKQNHIKRKRIMNDKNWKKIARSLLKQEKFLNRYNFPKPTGILVEWKGDIYISSTQEIAPEFSKEIILLNKSSDKIPDKLVNVIKELDPERCILYANNSLNLEGRQHVLKISDNKLEYMTPEQTEYMMRHIPIILVIS